jgi:trehalose 6-phosphate synthase
MKQSQGKDKGTGVPIGNKRPSRLRQIATMDFFQLHLVAAMLLGITAISGVSTYFDVLAHKHVLRNELERRTEWFGAGIQPQLEQQLAAGAANWGEVLRGLRSLPDQPALALFDSRRDLLGTAGEMPALASLPANLLERAIGTGREMDAFVHIQDNQDAPRLWLEEVMPVRAGTQKSATLVMLANADSIRAESMQIWKRSFLRIAAMVLLIFAVTLAMVRWFLHRPLKRTAEWLRRLRHGEAGAGEGVKEFGCLAPLAEEMSSLAGHLRKARAAAETEARLRNRGERVWTAERLAAQVRDCLGDGRLYVMSNREPYMHIRQGGETRCIVPPSGLVTALEPILQSCDGTWIAHGSGSEDSLYVDEYARLRVPPDDERYTLRRVWLTPEEESGYYEGFSNEGLWPLCHIAHTRPVFRAGDWQHYRDVNRRFADVLLEEMRETEHPVVFVQDYHFALVPAMIQEARPDARVAIFWHIPWPNPEAFGICPWQAVLLDGLLGADLIGFHLQSHCNNFMDTVDRVLEAKTDRENFSIRRHGHLSGVRPYPISVAWDQAAAAVERRRTANRGTQDGHDGVALTNRELGLRREWGIDDGFLVLGVDRMDYTKGIPERLLAFERLLEEHPWYKEQIVFVQIAAPSRTRIPAYARLGTEVQKLVERINQRYQTTRWKPVILIERSCSREEVRRYYHAADLCLVTPLHDGMNLVAKEFLEARRDGDGMLVLSRFAGAAQELEDALLVNPYDIVEVSEAIHSGLQMQRSERRLRMGRMRQQVKEHNVYRWAAEILTDLCAVRISEEAAEPVRGGMELEPA